MLQASAMLRESPRCGRQQCANCHRYHPVGPDNTSPHCFFITLRRSGRPPMPYTPASSSYTILLAPSKSAKLALRNHIWDEFDSVKVENEYTRKQMLSHRPSRKGDLRNEPPIPWLRWQSPRCEEGQTRKQENFEQIWERVTASARGMWVTCMFLTATCEDREGSKGELLDMGSSDWSSVGSKSDDGSFSSEASCHRTPNLPRSSIFGHRHGIGHL
jgi:hypothetical protein